MAELVKKKRETCILYRAMNDCETHNYKMSFKAVDLLRSTNQRIKRGHYARSRKYSPATCLCIKSISGQINLFCASAFCCNKSVSQPTYRASQLLKNPLSVLICFLWVKVKQVGEYYVELSPVFQFHSQLIVLRGAAQGDLPLIPVRVLSIAPCAYVITLHALWPITTSRPTCANQND